jgi:excisionase family DNA binding protein
MALQRIALNAIVSASGGRSMQKLNVEIPRVTLKVIEAAQMAGCGERAIRNGINAGEIPALRFGRSIRIPKSTFLKWLESCGGRTK